METTSKPVWLSTVFYIFITLILILFGVILWGGFVDRIHAEERSTVDLAAGIPNIFRAATESNGAVRDTLIRAKHDVQYQVLGEKRFPIVLGGRDDWLYYSGERNIDDYQNAFPMTEDELMQIYVNLEAINRRLAIHDKLLIVVVAPSRETIYPDWLPQGTDKVGDDDRMDKLMAYMDKMGAKTKILDLRDELTAARVDSPLLYPTGINMGLS